MTPSPLTTAFEFILELATLDDVEPGIEVDRPAQIEAVAEAHRGHAAGVAIERPDGRRNIRRLVVLPDSAVLTRAYRRRLRHPGEWIRDGGHVLARAFADQHDAIGFGGSHGLNAVGRGGVAFALSIKGPDCGRVRDHVAHGQHHCRRAGDVDRVLRGRVQSEDAACPAALRRRDGSGGDLHRLVAVHRREQPRYRLGDDDFDGVAVFDKAAARWRVVHREIGLRQVDIRLLGEVLRHGLEGCAIVSGSQPHRARMRGDIRGVLQRALLEVPVAGLAAQPHAADQHGGGDGDDGGDGAHRVTVERPEARGQSARPFTGKANQRH